jgi:hypothetical protein
MVAAPAALVAMAASLVFHWAAEAAPPSIHKCLDGGATQYQNVPCSSGQVALPYAHSASGPMDAGNDLVGSRPRQAEAAGFSEAGDIMQQWRHRDVVPGVSDTVVLNRPEWGRPLHISRARAAHGFLEEWKYGPDAEGRDRMLRFVNGRLAEIVREAPPAVAVRAPSNLPSNYVPGTMRIVPSEPDPFADVITPQWAAAIAPVAGTTGEAARAAAPSVRASGGESITAGYGASAGVAPAPRPGRPVAEPPSPGVAAGADPSSGAAAEAPADRTPGAHDRVSARTPAPGDMELSSRW